MDQQVKRHSGLGMFRVPEETQVVLGLVAEARKVSVAQVVRDALNGYAAAPETSEELALYRKQQERIRAASNILSESS